VAFKEMAIKYHAILTQGTKYSIEKANVGEFNGKI